VLNMHAGNVRVDAGQFEQMILNLAINARDAMAAGGELTIGVEARTLDAESSSEFNVAAGEYVVISVADTGVGMDEETRERCFEPFFTTKGPFKGTGLGLAAARRLVEESGGAIMCRSELGVGTTFEKMCIRDRPRTSPAVATPEPATTRAKRVAPARGLCFIATRLRASSRGNAVSTWRRSAARLRSEPTSVDTAALERPSAQHRVQK